MTKSNAEERTLDLFREHRTREQDVRETSLRVYREIEASGALSEQKLDVLRALASGGEMSAREIDQAVGVWKIALGRSYQPAVHHLVKSGAVEEVGVRPCKVTGRKVLAYRMTGRAPVPVRRTREPNAKAERARIAEFVRMWAASVHMSRADLASQIEAGAHWETGPLFDTKGTK